MAPKEKSPVWKYFVPAANTMSCVVCKFSMTARDGKFLSSNLERHLRTQHRNTDIYRTFKKEKEDWKYRNPVERISAIVSLPKIE